MRRLGVVLGLLLAAAPALAVSKFSGYVERGGQRALVNLLGQSVYVQRSYPGSTVTVYDEGTTNPATVYEDAGGTILKGPSFAADASGYYFWYGTATCYTVEFSGGGLPGPETKQVCSQIAATVEGPGVSVDGEAVVWSGNTGRVLGRATGSGLGRLTSGVLSADTLLITDIVDDLITFAKLQNIATDKLLGRDTAGTGDIESIGLSGGLEFDGALGLRRSALTGDVSSAAGSNDVQIAAGAVGAPEIATDGVGAAEIAADAVGASEIAADAVGSSEIAADAVAASEIATGAVGTAEIADGTVAFADIQNLSTDTLIGRDTAGTGVPEEIAVSGGLEMTGAAAIRRSALTGDVTAAAGSNTTAIANNAVTNAAMADNAIGSAEIINGAVAYADIQNLTTDTILGRDTAGSGVVEELTIGGGLEFTGTGGLQRSALTGDVTASAGSAATTIAADSVALTTDTTGNYVATVTGGNGMTGSGNTEGSTPTLDVASANGGIVVGANDISLTVAASANGLSATTQSGSGLEILTSGLALLQGCSDSQIIKWDEASDVWKCAADDSGAGGVADGDKGDITVSGSGLTWDIDPNAVVLATDTTGDYVATVTGTAAEITVSGSGGENAAVTLSLPAAIDLGGKTSLEVPNSSTPTVDAVGEIAVDSDIWAAGRGSLVLYDGTAATVVVNPLVSDVPSDGQIPKWNTGGTITWENDNAGGLADGDKGDVTVSGGGATWAVDADSVALTTDTTGNYVATITAGLGITGSVSTEGSTPTIALDTTAALSGDHTLAANEGKFGASGFVFEGASTNTIETFIVITDPTTSDKTITIPDRSGTVALSGDTFTGDVTATLDTDGSTALTVAADSVALTTDTTGNYVATIAAGLGISGSSSTEGGTPTMALDVSAALSGDHTLSANEGKFGSSGFVFEGSAADTSETFIAVTNPTADRTITVPDATGTLLLSGHSFTGDVTATLDTDGSTALTVAADSVALTTDTTGNYVATLTAGNGLTGDVSSEGSTPTIAVVSANAAIVANADNIELKVPAAADALSATTSNGSGLEVVTGGLAMLQGCSDGQLLKWVEATDLWTCSADSSGSVSDGDKGDIVVSASGATWSYDGIVGISKGGTGINFTDPNADQIIFWDDSAGAMAGLAATDGLTITTTNIGMTYPEQMSVTTSDFSKTSTTTLAAITGLSATLTAGATYWFSFEGTVTTAGSGGYKFDFGGTATATYFDARIHIQETSTTLYMSVLSTFGQDGGVDSSSGAGGVKYTGVIVVNAGGTFTPRFAQNTSSANASSVLRGAVLIVKRIS